MILYDARRTDALNALYAAIQIAERRYPNEGLICLSGSDEPERDAYMRKAFRHEDRYADHANIIPIKMREGRDITRPRRKLQEAPLQ
jgi:hypothetical protein